MLGQSFTHVRFTMRRYVQRAGLVLVLLGLLGACSDSDYQPPAELDLDVTRATLSNGLEVVAVPNHESPIVTALVTFRAGAFAETAEQSGYSHLLEHMLFAGCESVPDPVEMQDKLAALGISYNATTARDRVNYFYSMASDRLEPALELLSDSLRAPTLQAETLKRETAAVLAEFDLNDSNWDSVTRRHAFELLFDAFPNRTDALGRREAIERVTPQALRAMHDTYYVPNNAQLVLVGDVVASDGLKLAKRYFGSWKRAEDPFAAHPVPENPALSRTATDVLTGKIKESRLLVAYQGPSTDTDFRGAVAADVLARLSVLGNQEFRKLISPPEVIGGRIWHWPSRHKGVIALELYIGTGYEGSAIASLELMRDYVDHISDSELTAAKDALWTGRLRVASANLPLALQFSDDWALFGGSDPHAYLEALYAIGPDDLARLFQRYISARPRAGVLLTDPEHAERDLTQELENAW